MDQRTPRQRKVTSDARTSRVSVGLGTGTLALGATLLVALLGVLLVAFGALPAVVLLLVAAPLALLAVRFIQHGRPSGTS